MSVKTNGKGRARSARPKAAPAGGIEIRADDASLTPFGGGAVVGELARRLDLIAVLDRAIDGAPRVGGLQPVKQRDRGASAGEVLVSLAESMLLGGDCVLDIERLRADEAGAELRAVTNVPAASTMCQLMTRFRRSHLRAAEHAFSGCANGMDLQLGREPGGPVTLDYDSTIVEVHGRQKQGTGMTHQGQTAYQPLLCSWAERGRILGSELLAGNSSTRGEEPRQLLARTLRGLPDGHGEISARFDSGFYRIDLLKDCRKRGVFFSISVPRSTAMWKAMERVPEDAWVPAEGLSDTEVAETTYRPEGWKDEPLRLIIRRVEHQSDQLSDDPRARRKRTIPKQQLALGLAGEADLVYGYSFILTDRPGTVAEVEHHHRDRAQIEERIKDAKLGVSLRRLPLGDLDGNRVWMHATTLALNLLALLNDLMFGTEPPGHLPRRRQAKFVRRMLLCVPARVLHHARRTILRLPAGLASAPEFQAAYATARSLKPAATPA